MEETEYEYRIQFRHSGGGVWNNLRHAACTDIIDARALKRNCERTYGRYKNLIYRIVRRLKNWEPCDPTGTETGRQASRSSGMDL